MEKAKVEEAEVGATREPKAIIVTEPAALRRWEKDWGEKVGVSDVGVPVGGVWCGVLARINPLAEERVDSNKEFLDTIRT